MRDTPDPWVRLGSPHRRMRATPQHPIYLERLSKEHALLEDLIRREPPHGGLAEFIKSMDDH